MCEKHLKWLDISINVTESSFMPLTPHPHRGADTPMASSAVLCFTCR